MDYKEYPPNQLPERNPVTYQQHRQDVFWQITIPMLIVLALALVLVILALSGTFVQQSQWADISIIWLIIPSMLIGLVFFIVVAGLIYLVTILLGRLPPYARLAQDWLLVARFKVGEVGDKLVEPFLRIEEAKVSWQTLVGRMRRKR